MGRATRAAQQRARRRYVAEDGSVLEFTSWREFFPPRARCPVTGWPHLAFYSTIHTPTPRDSRVQTRRTKGRRR